jgi:hypothetical protein
MGTFLALSKSATTSALHISELVVLIFGLLLVCGLIGELSKSEEWSRAFGMMVVIGVAGELFGDGGIFVFTERLQALSDAEVATLNREAADARKAASEANERAAEAELALAKLQAKLTWSRLDETQQLRIAQTLRPFNFRGKLQIEVTGSQPSARAIAEDLLKVFQKARIDAELEPASTGGTPSVLRQRPPLTLRVPESARLFALALLKALRTEGILEPIDTGDAAIEASTTEDSVLFIGNKLP